MATLNVIEDDEAQSLVTPAETLGIIETAYKYAAAGEADVSKPAAFMLRGQTGTDTTFKVKGAVLDGLGIAGFRLSPDGVQTLEPGSDYLYVADAVTGRPYGMVSATWLHRVRTASTGLVACRALRPDGAKRLALIGTGRIAEEFVRVVHSVFPDTEIVLASRAPERAAASAKRWSELTANRLSAAPIREALAGADIVVTLSDAAEVLFAANDLAPHALLCAMGGRYEFDSDVLHAADAFVVDEFDFVCNVGSGAYWIGSGQVTRDDLAQRLDGTVGQILAGKVKVAPGGRTLAIVQGMAICDLAIAKTILDRAAAA